MIQSKTKNSSTTFDATPSLLMTLWRVDEKEKHHKRMTRIKKIDWNYTSRIVRAAGKRAPSPKWITALGRKTNWTPVAPRALMCLTVSRKGRAEKWWSWWLHCVTSLPEWGNRRWHLADSLTLADLLGAGWLLWFWNYSLDELEHFTKKNCCRNGSCWSWDSTLRETGRRKQRLYDQINKADQLDGP